MKKNNLLKIVILILVVGLILGLLFFLKSKKVENNSKSENKIENVTDDKPENKVTEEKEETNLSKLDIEERDEISKEKIENFLKVYKNSSPKGILISLGLIDENYTSNPEDYIDRFYAKTDIKYEDFKNKLLEFVTEKLFNSYYDNQGFKNVDEYLCFSDIGGEEREYKVENMSLIDHTDSSMTYEISFFEESSNNIENAKITVIEKNNDYVVDIYEKL